VHTDRQLRKQNERWLFPCLPFSPQTQFACYLSHSCLLARSLSGSLNDKYPKNFTSFQLNVVFFSLQTEPKPFLLEKIGSEYYVHMHANCYTPEVGRKRRLKVYLCASENQIGVFFLFLQPIALDRRLPFGSAPGRLPTREPLAGMTPSSLDIFPNGESVSSISYKPFVISYYLKYNV
jgi:hypothetical protein